MLAQGLRFDSRGVQLDKTGKFLVRKIRGWSLSTDKLSKNQNLRRFVIGIILR